MAFKRRSTSTESWREKSDAIFFAWLPFKAYDQDGKAHWVFWREFYLVGLDLGTLYIIPSKYDPEQPEYYLYLPKRP